MRFMVNEYKKIIFGWSPKCGCSHVKKIVHFLEQRILDSVHVLTLDTNELPDDISDYIFIIIIRNPFKRLVSGFFEKYRIRGQFRNLWNNNMPNLSFSNFLEEIEKQNFDVIDYAHFSKQTDEFFIDEIVDHKKTIIYDIENIDYDYIGSLYCKIIPADVITFRGDHINKNTEPMTDIVYDKHIDELLKYKISLECYYNDKLTDKVLQIYRKDFDFFESKGFYYSCKSKNDLTRDYSKSIAKVNTYNSSKFINRRIKT